MARSYRLDVDVDGDREFSRKISRFGDLAQDFTPAMLGVLEVIRESTRQNERTTGWRINAPWRPLTAPYLARKIARGLDPRLMLATHDLYNSLAHASSGSIADAGPGSLDYGTRVPYFGYHQSRAPRDKMPRRPLVGLTEGDSQEIVEEIRRHALALRKAARLSGSTT